MILNRITRYNAPTARKEFSHWRGLEKDWNFAVDKKTTANLLSQDGITYTRASLATYKDASGDLASAASNEPAYEYNGSTSLGMRIEKGTTNIIRDTAMTNSGDWNESGAVWPGSGHIEGPDGVSDSGIKFEGATNTGSSYHAAWDNYILTTWSGGAHKNNWSASIYVKRGNCDYFGMAFASAGKVGAAFDLSVMGVQSYANCTASVEDVGNGWMRLKCENLQNIANPSYGFFMITVSATSGGVWDDDGFGAWNQRSNDVASTGPTVPNHAFVFGPQYEDSTYCTSYIANPSRNASGSTRADTVVSVIPDNFSFYNQSEGTFALEGRKLVAGSSALPTSLEVNDNSTSDTMGFNTSATKEQFDVVDPSGSATIEAGGHTGIGAFTKLAGAYAAGNYGVCRNGGTVVTNTLAHVPAVTQLHFGQSEHSGRRGDGHISRVRYYKRRLKNKQLKTLSNL
tara:strand:+ start:1603 stop:2970 length:1368 start_codon:yes stop_codon:yes gene_type:complete